MNQIHVIMMLYHKFSFFFGCRTASLERLLVRKCEALAIVIHRFGVFFSFLIDACCHLRYMISVYLSIVNNNRKQQKLWKPSHDYDVGK